MMCDTMFREWSADDLDTMVKNLVEWLMLNPHTKWKQGNDGNFLDQKSVFFNDMMLRFFLFYAVKKEFRHRALRSLLHAVAAIDSALLDQRFSIRLAINISKHVNSVLGSFIKLCLSDEDDVAYFIDGLNGFNFLRKRLSLGADAPKPASEAPSLDEIACLTDFEASS